jgi:hypothetical protein
LLFAHGSHPLGRELNHFGNGIESFLSLKDYKKVQHTAIIVEKLYQEQELSLKEICEQPSISRGTFNNYLGYPL